MNADVMDRLADFVLGVLPEGEMREIREQVDASPALQAEVAAMTEALASTADVLPPISPSKRTRARLLDALAGPDRFSPFFELLARKFDLAVDAIRTLLAGVDDPSAWEEGPFAGLRLIHFSAGPAVTASDTGFVRLAAGMEFPRHRHVDKEMTIVLEGTMIDNGRTYGPGSVVEWDADSVHVYYAGPERDLLMMVTHSGIELTDK